MAKKDNTGLLAGTSFWRWATRFAFLAFFVLLTYTAAFPASATPPSNLMLRFDPLAGIFAATAARSASVFLQYWPAWVLLGLTVLSSRFFCGWICPLGTCFDLVAAAKPDSLTYYNPKSSELKEVLEERRDGKKPRRIRIKYIMLLVVLVLSLVGINLLYFFSPLVVLNRSIYFMLLPQVPVLLIILLLLAFLYRPRFWCEEICPLGALFSLVSWAGKKLPSVFSPVSVVKDQQACVMCGACYRECPFGVEEPYTREESGRLRSLDCTACGQCVDVCPSEGALALESFGFTVRGSSGKPASRDFTGRPESTVVVVPEATDDRFTVSRKEFLASAGVGAVLLAGYGVGLRDLGEPVLRMPGAQDESRFLAACTRCGMCTRTCPTGCIKPMGMDGGFQKLWTPRFNPRTACCTFDQCDQACAGVCPSGAIEKQSPSQVRIGTAHINRSTCLAWKGGICLACKERCRFDAIDSDSKRRPHVNTENCTGCGACQMTCPTEPTSIEVLPVGRQSNGSDGTGGRRNKGGG